MRKISSKPSTPIGCVDYKLVSAIKQATIRKSNRVNVILRVGRVLFTALSCALSTLLPNNSLSFSKPDKNLMVGQTLSRAGRPVVHIHVSHVRPLRLFIVRHRTDICPGRYASCSRIQRGSRAPTPAFWRCPRS